MTPHTPMCVPLHLHPTLAILCRNREVGVSRGRTRICGVAPLTRTSSGTSPGPQQSCGAGTAAMASQHRPFPALPPSSITSAPRSLLPTRSPVKGSWGLYGHRPRPDSKEWVTNRMGGAPGPCQSQRGDVSPGGGWKQAGHVEKSGKEAGVLRSASSGSLEGAARTGSCPHGAPWHCQARATSRHVQHSHASVRDCTRLAGHPPRAPSPTPSHWGGGRGRAGGLLPPSAMGMWQARVSLTFPLAPNWMKAQTGW